MSEYETWRQQHESKLARRRAQTAPHPPGTQEEHDRALRAWLTAGGTAADFEERWQGTIDARSASPARAT